MTYFFNNSTLCRVRLGRSTSKLLGLTEELQQRGVEFISLKDHIDNQQRHREGYVPHVGRSAGSSQKDHVGGRPRVDGTAVEKTLKLY